MLVFCKPSLQITPPTRSRAIGPSAGSFVSSTKGKLIVSPLFLTVSGEEFGSGQTWGDFPLSSASQKSICSKTVSLPFSLLPLLHSALSSVELAGHCSWVLSKLPCARCRLGPLLWVWILLTLSIQRAWVTSPQNHKIGLKIMRFGEGFFSNIGVVCSLSQ